jgi:hypothetical protein
MTYRVGPPGVSIPILDRVESELAREIEREQQSNCIITDEGRQIVTNQLPKR